jgi:hypothetical protein
MPKDQPPPEDPPPRRHKSIAEYIEAIDKNGGIISGIANTLGVTPSAVRQRIAASPELQAAVRETKERLLDMCESNVLLDARAGNVKTSQWYLKHQGRHRGYGSQSQPQSRIREILIALERIFGGGSDGLRRLASFLGIKIPAKPGDD